MEMSSNETIKQAVMAGMGIASCRCTRSALELETPAASGARRRGPAALRRWHVVNTARKLLSPAAEAFRYFILEHGEALLAQQFPGWSTRSPGAARQPGRGS